MNQDVYLDLLQAAVWPMVRAVAASRRYWLQQHGTTARTADRVKQWLEEKIGDRVISRFTGPPAPPTCRPWSTGSGS